MPIFSEDEYLQISVLSQYAYCPRRCFLLYKECEFAENIHTVLGTQEHENVDAIHNEIKGKIKVEYALPVWSSKLGLIGKCDVVEFHDDRNVYPIEYKHGKKRQWMNNDLQLTAQALCLEEMLACHISKGAIYHIKSNRRRELQIDSKIRTETIKAIAAVRELFACDEIPVPIANQRQCIECAMKNVCKPEFANDNYKLKKAYDSLFLIEQE